MPEENFYEINIQLCDMISFKPFVVIVFYY